MPMQGGRGRSAFKPVGWLSLNDRPGGRGAAIAAWRAKTAWRTAAYNALLRRRLPTGLARIYVQVEFRFPDRLHRDPSNFEPTVKPIIDALQTTRQYHRKKRGGGLELVVEPGIGMVLGDDPRYLVRGPELPVGEPLGRANPIKGVVILHIVPLPPEENT